MTSHQAKRPYGGSQPAITNYFPQTNSPNQVSPTTKPPAPSPSERELPATVQANLLSVGMRVRKAVPEGYKTGDYSAFTLFSDPCPPGSGGDVADGNNALGQKVRVGSRPRARELEPFCGILKVGGLAQQQLWRISEEGGEEEDDVPVLSSQGSTISDVSVASSFRANKRRFEGEDEGEDEDEVGVVVERQGAFPTIGLPGRAIAVPRRKKGGEKAFGVGIVAQENSMDFEEADFLDYGTMRDMDMSDA